MAAPLCYDRVTNCVNFREFTGLAEPENRDVYKRQVYNDVHSCGKGGNLSTKAYKPTLNLF